MAISAIVLLSGAALGLTSCGRFHARVDPDVDDGVGGGGTDSQDVRRMADSVARSLLASARIFRDGKRPTIYVMGLTNRASRPINKDMVLRMVVTRLVMQGGERVRILDRSKATMDAVREERRAKRAGELEGNEKKALLGSDFVLTGEVDTISKRGRDSMSSDYWVYSYKLVDLESSEQVWAGEDDFKWAGDKPAIYR